MITNNALVDAISAQLPRDAKIHFRVLDSWRGIAALLVAVFHLNILSAIYSLEFIRNSYLFVDFFFVLSGFVITHSYAARLGTLEGVGTFALRRLGRLWPLHVVVLLALVIVEGARAVSAARGASFHNPPFTGSTSLHSILTNLLFGQSFGIEQQLTWNPPSWSICAEFWTYLIFATVLLIGSTWLRRFRFATETLLVAVLIASVCILVLFARYGIDATYDLGLARCVYGFFIGHLTYRLWQAASHLELRTGLVEVWVLIATVVYVSAAGHTAYTFVAPLVFGLVVFTFAFETGPVSALMLNRGNAWLGRISYSIYMWQAFIIFNFVDRPVSMLEKITGHSLTTTESASSALGGEAGKLIVLGGHVLPIIATLLLLGFLIIVASISYCLIEKPGQELFARLARWLRSRSIQGDDRSLGPVRAAGMARSP
jgi:peptidoglycan/LPS O-acetylase OafA/YrhL